MPKKISVAATLFVIACAVIACTGHKYHHPNTGADLAANVVDIASEALLKDDGGPKWDELDRRLHALFSNNSKEGDEAVVILMNFYLGEHEGEEVEENLLSRGPRMIPLVELYLHQEPSSLLNEYPRRVRLERTTTVGFLKEDLQILRVQAGAHQIAKASVEVFPRGEKTGGCTSKLLHQPEFQFPDNLIQPGEHYRGAPWLRADIDDHGDVKHVELTSSSGIQKLDNLVLAEANKWKYAVGPGCGSARADIGVIVDWMPTN